MILAYQSLRTVSSLLLTNKDFRILVDDLAIVGRQVLSDTAASVSGVADEASKSLEPAGEQVQSIQGPGADEGEPPSKQEMVGKAEDASKEIADGAEKVAKDTIESAKRHASGRPQQTLIHRLRQTITGLRGRTDYAESVSTISRLIQSYAMIYSRVADETVSTVQEDVDPNADLESAARKFWDFLSNFGDKHQWQKLENDFKAVMQHTRRDPDLEIFMKELGSTVEKMLLDPNFFDQVDDQVSELREKSAQIGDESDLKADLDKFLQQLRHTVRTGLEDRDLSQLMTTALNIVNTLSPPGNVIQSELITDGLNIFLPLLIRAVQNVPIPRLEVSIPEMDLLLENLIIEPGRTVNASSFLPYRMLVSTQNDVEIRKTHSKRTKASMTSLLQISINGLSVSAQDLGFWIRAHPNSFLRFADEGIASFALDERGIDIALDVEIGRERLEHILSLRGVKVQIYKLDYTLRKSKLSWLGWLLKPFLKQLIRRALEKVMAESIADLLHAANRELLFARERLRATRIADPQDLTTFIKAIISRLSPADDPDVYTRVGLDAPRKGRFHNVYTPGSVVKLWHEEAIRAEEVVDDAAENRPDGWRNEIFDVRVH